MVKFKRITIIVLDSVGIGELPDAFEYGDEGANTLKHIAENIDNFSLPNLENFGLGNIDNLPGIPRNDRNTASYGKMMEQSVGKDTLTGHWEIMGLKTDTPFNTFPEGFPKELINELEEQTGRKVIGNKVASGTEIINELGEEHLRTGALIIYTSADSVLQIAAHEEVIPVEELYKICEIARTITLQDKFLVGRVIARPFLGEPKQFFRTANRKDYAIKPFAQTVMNYLTNAGYDSIAIGKIHDIFSDEGITKSIKTESNLDGINKTIEVLNSDFTGLLFVNLVDFDSKYGHRRDVIGYGKALQEFDSKVPNIVETLSIDDLLIITADHGNDPTFKGTDHTREYVPLLVYSPKIRNPKNLGIRSTFADIGATIVENFSLKSTGIGNSFLKEILK